MMLWTVLGAGVGPNGPVPKGPGPSSEGLFPETSDLCCCSQHSEKHASWLTVWVRV